MTKETLSALLTLVMAFVHRKYKIYIFYGVIICDKYYSIINNNNNKKVLATNMKPSKILKYFGGKITPYFSHL